MLGTADTPFLVTQAQGRASEGSMAVDLQRGTGPKPLPLRDPKELPSIERVRERPWR